MIRTRALASIGMVLAGMVFLPAAALPAETSAAATAHRATLDQYCIVCHSGPTPPAGLNLQALAIGNLEGNRALWEEPLRNARHPAVPPAASPRPAPAPHE